MNFTGARRVALLAAVFATGTPTAQAGSLPAPVTGIDRAQTTALVAADAVRRDCAARSLTGRRGIARTTWTAPADGVLTARLRGTGDWDLALFDAASGARVASSSAFRANEVAQVGLRRGATVVVQACRRTGGARRARLRTQFARVDAGRVAAQSGPVQLVRVVVGSRAAFEALEERFDVTHDSGAGFATLVVYGTAERRALEAFGLPVRVLEADLFAAERRARAAERARTGRSALPSGRTTYRTYEDYQAELKQMVEQFPELVQPITLKNESFQGRDIQAIEIAANVRGGDDGRPVFTLGALHHAREWPAAESAMEFAWDLLNNHASDANLGRILNEVRVVVMPLTNPDGFLVSRNSPEVDPEDGDGGVYSLTTGVVLFGGSLAYKRKNCNPVLTPSEVLPCEFALGVDPNRNYATNWGGPGASTNPNDQGYRGAAPFSEPETAAVQELSSMFNSPVHVSTHNVAAKVLRPPGLEAEGLAPDEAGLKALGAQMATPTGYANEYGWQLYDTTGTTKDWGYDALGQYSYTVEMGPPNGYFHGDYKVHVENQYLPTTGKLKGRGLREAYIRAALFTRSTTQTSRLTGTAPAGATLRITKDFTTETYPVCAVVDPLPIGLGGEEDPQYCTGPGEVQQVPEHVEFSMQVPESGQFTWWVNPSTRPFAEGPEAYELTCSVGGTLVETQAVMVARGETKAVQPCGA